MRKDPWRRVANDLSTASLALWRRLDAATSVASRRAMPGIAIVGLDYRHDRFGRPGAC
jgi:hypothetical protein